MVSGRLGPGSVELKHCAIQSIDFAIHSAGLARDAPETVQFDAGTPYAHYESQGINSATDNENRICTRHDPIIASNGHEP